MRAGRQSALHVQRTRGTRGHSGGCWPPWIQGHLDFQAYGCAVSDTVRTCVTSNRLWLRGKHVVPEGSLMSRDFILVPSFLCFPSSLKFLPASYLTCLVLFEISVETCFPAEKSQFYFAEESLRQTEWDSPMYCISTKNIIPSQEIGFKSLKKNCF